MPKEIQRGEQLLEFHELFESPAETPLYRVLAQQKLLSSACLLIQHEEQAVKETQKEKELRLQQEQEERERKEREKREKKARQLENQEELTVEEWIAWMEEKKKQGMTPE